MNNDVEFLILSSSIDYSTDLICLELHSIGKRYLRINRDSFDSYKISYSLQDESMQILFDEKQYYIRQETLKGVYYRAPVFLRYNKKYKVEEQLYRSQWSSFLRNLIVFDKAIWVNNPVDTYRAENKIFQLKCANEIGLKTPTTYIGNFLPKDLESKSNYVVKSLDTALFYNDTQEMFTYSNILDKDEIKSMNIQSAPVILQECLNNKTDVRITYVDGEIFPVSITKNGKGIDGDWRKTKKDELKYDNIVLPKDIYKKLVELMYKLNLKFGGIDFAIVNGEYYFIEVNPTGEWGWLQMSNSIPISKAIVKCLSGENI